MALNSAQLIVRTAGLVNAKLKYTHWPLFFTLSYRDGAEWESKQISKFIDNYRVFIKRNGFPDEKLTYIWTAENNKDRDYIHYHGIIWVPIGVYPPKPDNQGWWTYGSTNVQRAYNPAAYIAKYIGKSNEPLKIPKRARTYSIQSRVINIDYLRCPNWMCFFSKFGDKIKRVAGYGWVNFTTMKCYDSPYQFCKNTGLKWIGWNENKDFDDFNTGRCGKKLDHMDLWLIATERKPVKSYTGAFSSVVDRLYTECLYA